MKKILLLCGSLFLIYSCREGGKVKHSAIKDPDYDKAISFFEKQNDSAFYYFNQVAIAAKDSVQTANAWYYMAYLQSIEGDYFSSEENLTMSLRYLDTVQKKNYKTLASTFNELGLTSIQLSNYQDGVNFFQRAIHFAVSKENRLVFLNNKALANEKNGNYVEALKIYQHILPLIKDKETRARTVSNMARTKWLAITSYDAAPELLTALHIRQQANDQWGLNASYSHLSDYYRAKKPDSALYYASRMYVTAKKINSPDDQLSALEKLITLASATNAKRYFLRYHKLNDSLETARNAAKNRFAYMRYQVERKEADNQKLAKGNAEKQIEITKRNAIIWSAIAIFIVVIILLSYRYKKRREQAVKDNQLRLAAKVHNKLANGLYQLIQEIDNHEGFDKEMIAQELTVLHELSRDISHEEIAVGDRDFTEKIDRLLYAFAGPSVNLAVVGNEPEYWHKVSSTLKSELEEVLQEWMINMKKHSQANNVSVQFNRAGDELEIIYFDNGVGMSIGAKSGKGLQFAETRIKSLGGTLNFDAQRENGTRIVLTLLLT